MTKRGTDDISTTPASEDEQLYKVRVAVTLAHYVLVTAESHDEAERKADDYVRKLTDSEGGFDRWWAEASHINTSFEVEESDEPVRADA